MYEVLARRFRRGRAAKEAKLSGAAESEAEAEQTRDHIDWDLPDLFVVDGGRGQLNVALAAARDLGLHELSIVGLAKEKTVPGYPARGAPSGGDDAPRDDGGREDAALSEEGASAQSATTARVPTDDVPKKRRGRVAEPKKPTDLVDRVYLPGQKNGIPLQPNSAPLFFLARARDEAHRFSNRARERLGKARKFRSQLDDIPGVGPVTRRALLRILGSLDGVRRASDEALLAVPGVSRRTLRAIRTHFPPPPAVPLEPLPPTGE